MTRCPKCNVVTMDGAQVCGACGASVVAAPLFRLWPWMVAAVLAMLGMFAVVGFAFVPPGGVITNETKRLEVTSRLNELKGALETFREAHDAGPRTFAEAEFEFRPHRRYAYFVGDDVVQPDVPSYGPYARPAGLSGDEVAVAVCNLDEDPDLDVWVLKLDGTVSQVANDF
jgi:hypothetical protein